MESLGRSVGLRRCQVFSLCKLAFAHDSIMHNAGQCGASFSLNEDPSFVNLQGSRLSLASLQPSPVSSDARVLSRDAKSKRLPAWCSSLTCISCLKKDSKPQGSGMYPCPQSAQQIPADSLRLCGSATDGHTCKELTAASG